MQALIVSEDFLIRHLLISNFPQNHMMWTVIDNHTMHILKCMAFDAVVVSLDIKFIDPLLLISIIRGNCGEATKILGLAPYDFDVTPYVLHRDIDGIFRSPSGHTEAQHIVRVIIDEIFDC